MIHWKNDRKNEVDLEVQGLLSLSGFRIGTLKVKSVNSVQLDTAELSSYFHTNAVSNKMQVTLPKRMFKLVSTSQPMK